MRKVIVNFILIVSIITFPMSIFPISYPIKSKYERTCDKYEMDFFKLYVEIVKPAVDIEDIDEFFHYFKRDDILTKIHEAAEIVEVIKSVVRENNLSSLYYLGIDDSLFPLQLLAEAVIDWGEVAEDEDVKELMRMGRYASLEELLYDSVNGALGYKYRLKHSLESYEGIVNRRGK